MNYFSEDKNWRKKIMVGCLLFFLIFNVVAAEPVKAQFITSNLTLDADSLKKQLKEALASAYKNLGSAAGRALIKTFKNFLNKFAQDSATFLASGNFNKGPMWITDAGSYWKNAGDSAAGDFIATFGDEWALTKKYGINLCAPESPELRMALKLTAINVQNPQPRCKLSDVAKAYERVAEPGYWDKVAVGFEPGQNGLSASSKLIEGMEIIAAENKAAAVRKAQLEGQVTPPTSPVSQQAVSPRAVTESAIPSAKEANAAKQAEVDLMKQDLTSGNILSALKDVGTVFLDTLSNKLQDKLLKVGMNSVGSLWRYISDKSGSSGTASYEAQLAGNREASQAYFADFTKPSFTAIEDYQYLPELSNDCSTNASPYCGALDESFKEIFNLAQTGETLTVAEAIKKQLLHEDWPILGPGIPCSPQSYCYDNLVKLRILRILPIGWELAAKVSATKGQPTRLGDATNSAFYNANGDYFHLIDPNWLITAPKARCAAQAYGSTFFSTPEKDVPGQRIQYCADIQNCVGEDLKTGLCNSWGYCLRERNNWRVAGDSCDAQFNTCTLYTSSKGKQVNYLANTLNRGICTSDNVGCRGYATNATLASAGLLWNTTNKIYFDQDAEFCEASAEGCTRFTRTAPEVSSQPLNLKKAPNYYNCYGDNLPVGTFSSSSLPWAVNKADLYKVFAAQTAGQKQACANFAQVCSYEEKGCELYTPDNGNPAVPGILTTSNQCPNECVGYETYKEQTISQFSADTTNYFIPATAQSCSSENVGCEEFINLESQTAGGEQKEFYSALRICSKNEAEGGTYYTWEGSDTTGYQLKTYLLKKKSASPSDTINYVASFEDTGTDGPIYIASTSDELACTASNYANRTTIANFNPDCREFYGKDGSKYYRLYSKTVTTSPTDCKTLRKTISDEVYCPATGGLWNASQKFCTYQAITKEAKSCPAEAVGCRAYKGNAGNNYITIASENFESGSVGSDARTSLNWVGNFSAESTVLGGKSLKVNSATSQTFSGENNKTYLVYFWAKGNNVNLDINFYASDSSGAGSLGVPETVKLNNNWELYTVGPFTSTWDPATASTTIKFISSAPFYLDNYTLKVMTSNIFVVKDSWVTPASCDNIIGDPNGETAGGSFANPLKLVPQAQLGCAVYNTRQNQPVAAKSFSNICRAEAVGCEELVDTFNTLTASSTIANALCELNITSTSNQAIGCKDNSGQVRCDVVPQQKSCHFNFVGTEPELATLSVGATTIDVEGKNYTVLLRIDSDQSIIIPQDRKVFLVNDSRFQCSDSDLGCRALGNITYDTQGTAVANTISYVKDQPANYSKILCEQGAEGCDKYTKSNSGTDYFRDPTVFGKNLCEWKNPISETNPVGGWVIKGTSESCYPGLNFKILNNGDTDYRGAVGICPAEQTNCTEFVDPVGGGNTLNPLGQPYYLINNEKIDRSSCQGQASLQKGCVLFNETSKGDLLWSASSTYKVSEDKNYEKVNPVDCGVKGEKGPSDNSGCFTASTDKNDANVVLKVTRDRVCGEWLACASSMKVMKDGKPTEICTQFKNCDQASVSNTNSNELLGKCAHWVEETVPATGTRLTANIYKGVKDVATFSVKDFSGYSITDGYQISDLGVEVDTTSGKFGLKRLSIPNQGVFANQKDPIAESCRGFASADATLDSVNLCSFAKVTYSGGDKTPIDKYYSANQLLSSTGVCDGGFDETGKSKKELTCSSDLDCSDDRLGGNASTGGFKLSATCLTNKQINRQFGWPGYCLFQDPASKACLQWFPLTVPSNTNNLYELNSTAGYYPPEESGKFWCVQAKGNSNRKSATNDENEVGSGYAFTGRHEEYVRKNTSMGAYTDKDTRKLFPSTGSWDEFNPVLKEEEAGLNISEIAAIGIKVLNAQSSDWPSKGNELLIFPDQILSGIPSGGIAESGGDQTGNGFYWSGPLKFSASKQPYLDLVWSLINKKSKAFFNSSNFDFLSQDLCTRLGGGSSNDPNFLGIRFIFDATKGTLTGINTKMCDGSPTDGWLVTDLVYYLKEVCTEIRQVVDTESVAAQRRPFGLIAKARTDRVWSESGYKLGGDVKPSSGLIPLDLTYNQFNAPFGSMSRNTVPVIQTINTVLTDKKTAVEKKEAFRQYGFWPIWFGAGGGTPLSCAGLNSGDCGNIGVCVDGGKKGMTCDPNVSPNKNGCRTNYPQGVCKGDFFFCAAGIKLTSGVTLSADTISCTGLSDTTSCNNRDLGPCITLGLCSDGKQCKTNNDCSTGTCEPNSGANFCEKTLAGRINGSYINRGVVACSNDSACIITNDSSLNKCVSSVNNYCVGGTPLTNDIRKACGNDGDCSGGNVDFACNALNTIRGTCVGGQNHGLACTGNTDCPAKTYTATENNKEVIENGVCVGSSLDDGKTISKGEDSYPYRPGDIPSQRYPDRNYCRLREIFAQVFNTWFWNPDTGTYADRTGINTEGVNTEDMSPGSAQRTANGYTLGCETGSLPNSAINPFASYSPRPPKIYSLLTSTSNPLGFTWGAQNNFTVNSQDSGTVSLIGSNAVATANFFAYADNDQMPIQRIAIDWGDNSPVYITKGWYKNHKPLCVDTGNKVCKTGTVNDLNRPCIDNLGCQSGSSCEVPAAISDIRLHFGNSSGACDTDYFSFKHIYECKNGGPGWNSLTATCSFIPKIQILDNWGWCNSQDGAGRWNGNYLNNQGTQNPQGDPIEENSSCFVGKIEPWTSFGGVIEVRP